MGLVIGAPPPKPGAAASGAVAVDPPRFCQRFDLQIQVMDKRRIYAGYECVMHTPIGRATVRFSELKALTTRFGVERPKSISTRESGLVAVVIPCHLPSMFIESFAACPLAGRVLLTDHDKMICIGVTKDVHCCCDVNRVSVAPPPPNTN